MYFERRLFDRKNPDEDFTIVYFCVQHIKIMAKYDASRRILAIFYKLYQKLCCKYITETRS